MSTLNSPLQLQSPKQRNEYLILLLSFIFFIAQPQKIHAETEQYYVRSDIKTRNGVIVESNLLVIPANSDFRNKKFTRYKVIGQVTAKGQKNIVNDAKNNALLNLVSTNGNTVIHGTTTTTQTHPHEESILSHEGFIKMPYTLTAQNYTHDNTLYQVEIEIWFAPMADPSEWHFHYIKKKLSDLFSSVLSVFHAN